MEYEDIGTLAQIMEIKQKQSSPDGEGLSFELKGSNGSAKFTKDLKKLLAKEICAFANTYGGIVCFHGGKDDEILPFQEAWIDANFVSIDSWLSDSLETKHMGMKLKKVDGVLLINVPESQTKPHKAVNDHYYYRHSASSKPMPEIMISSMYRSQGFLDFGIDVKASKQDYLFAISAKIKNYSNIAGTKPKLMITLYGYKTIPEINKLLPNDYFHVRKPVEYGIPVILLINNIKPFLTLETNTVFADALLYPQDQFLTSAQFRFNDELQRALYILVKTDCMFKESIRKTDYMIVVFDAEKGDVFMTTDRHSEQEVIKKFVELI